MQPILDKISGWGWAETFGRSGAVILTLLVGMAVARGDSTNFVGDFSAAVWTQQPQYGSVSFTNSDTELVLAGPNAPTVERFSLDGILYAGPASGGLTVDGTVQFHWAYDSGDALSISEADFAWTVPGGGGPVPNVLAQGGPGVIQSGDFVTPVLGAGTTFEFLLSTDTLANKLSGSLVISGFEFHSKVPEPSTGALFASVLISLGAARWVRSRRQPSARQ